MTTERDASPGPIDRPGRLPRWWLARSMRAKGMTVIAIPLIALIGITSASLALLRDEHHARGVSSRDFTASNAAAQVLADLVNAETGVRGYAATHDALFLDPYTLARSRIAADRRALHDSASAPADRIEQTMVDATTATALAELAQLRTTAGTGAPAADVRAAFENEKTTMDRLRDQVAQLAARPTIERATQRVNITKLEQKSQLLDIVGLVLALLAGLAGVALFTSGVSRRVTAAAENADRLGQGRPLEPVRSSSDELGRLAASLVRAEELLATRAADLITARDGALLATHAKNAFLSHTSHELRTPLNSILGFAQLLQISDLAVEDRDSADRILGAGRHLLALINELIDVARIESGDLNLSVEPVALTPVIADAAELLRPLAAEREITIVDDCTKSDLAARADRQRLSQVLVNLVSNAIKYSRRGGTITIACLETGDEVAVVVSDTGPGITAADLERIFVPFERLHAAEAGIEGTGIGLPLAKALTEAMGGRLTASSVIDEGSAFTVALERAPDTGAHAGADVDAALAGRGPAPVDDGPIVNVLYIEDNPDNVEVVARFLRSKPNTRLQSVGSGREGIERTRRDLPDVVLLDLHLSDLHGSEVLDELRTEPRTAAIPVIILSADATPVVVRRLLARGARAYLTKPIDLIELGELLDASTAPAGGPRPLVIRGLPT